MISIKNKSKIEPVLLPLNYSIKLAEETGIHIGDGSMNAYRNGTNWSYTYSGHAQDDFEFSKYIKNLMKSLYNITHSYERIQKNTLMVSYFRKDLVMFKHKIGLPMGIKDNIKIPNWILANKDFMIACVRGIFATDGCLRFQKKYKKINYWWCVIVS